jgi:hypothetical protein
MDRIRFTPSSVRIPSADEIASYEIPFGDASTGLQHVP